MSISAGNCMYPRPDEERGNASEHPFEPPAPSKYRSGPTKDPSVFEEPWMQQEGIPPVLPEGPHAADTSEEQQAENSVWDEPSTSAKLAGETPIDGMTWHRWFQIQVERTSYDQTVLTTLCVAACSGITAILGALVITPDALLATIVAAPVVEEILKIALAIWVVEKRPWLFASRTQILLCGAAAGLVFACIENGIYLLAYIADPTATIIVWRWTVCVALHVGCSTLAAAGVARVWTRFQEERRMPRLQDGAMLITSAIILHGTYNLLATLLELSGAFY